MGYFIRELLLIMAAAAPVYLLLRRPWRHWNRREAALGLFTLFMVGLLALALSGNYGTPAQMWELAASRLKEREYINFKPFYTISTFFRHLSMDDFLVNIVGNMVLFIPWGFGLVLLWKKNRKFWRLCLLAFSLTAMIETVQLFIGRHVDVDDLILNFAGAMLGAGLWAGLKRFFPVLDTFTARTDDN